MKKLQPVRGTKDILEEEYREIDNIVQRWESITEGHGFNTIQTPIIEDSEVFKKTLGMTSDIIKKETYTFKDRSNNEIILRPEGTASVVRLFINNKLHHVLPQKLSYQGQMFRYDRPQKGRLRQFHQLGAEIIGEKDILADLELIQMAIRFINKIGIDNNKFKILINSLGDEESRKKYSVELKNFFQDHKKDLTTESLERLKKNPLRILDTKNEKEKKLLVKAPKLKNFLSSNSSDVFDEFKENCKELKIPIVVDDNLVRGLDYYNNICYEFVSKNIGSQDSFLAGGRYDGLVKKMGGPDYPGCGFAVGVERIRLLGASCWLGWSPKYVAIAIGKENKIKAMKIINRLRFMDRENESASKKSDILLTLEKIHIPHIDFICRDNLSKGLKYASENKAHYALILGVDEILNKKITIKDLKTRKQKKLNIEDLFDHLLSPTSIFL